MRAVAGVQVFWWDLVSRWHMTTNSFGRYKGKERYRHLLFRLFHSGGWHLNEASKLGQFLEQIQASAVCCLTWTAQWDLSKVPQMW